MYCLDHKKVCTFIFVLLIVLGGHVGLGQCETIVQRARVDVGILEEGIRHNTNKGALMRYYRNNANINLNKWDAPYCGAALFSWFLEAGLRPKVKTPEVAANWQRANSVRLGIRTKPKDIAKLTPGMAINMRFSGNHVGVLERPENTYAVTIEGNTSDPTDPRKKNKREGVHRKIRPYFILISASDWCSDAAKVDSTIYLKLKPKRL